jgi:hypothetical protein
MYSLRHTFASLGRTAGEAAFNVAAVMGHSRSYLVDQVYAHSLQSGMASVAERVTARAPGGKPVLRVLENPKTPDIRRPLDASRMKARVALPTNLSPRSPRPGWQRERANAHNECLERIGRRWPRSRSQRSAAPTSRRKRPPGSTQCVRYASSAMGCASKVRNASVVPWSKVARKWSAVPWESSTGRGSLVQPLR